MKKNRRKYLACLALFAALCLVGFAIRAAAQTRPTPPAPTYFSGLINDYSPATVKGGPWEMHGTWSLELHERSGTADFSAAMTMSDYGTLGGVTDPTQAGQNAHTHHIKLTNAAVTLGMIGCPTFSPATQTGFQINGTASLLTGNGGNAPFETTPPSSTLQVCITGGTEVANSNITMVFGGPATTHFGPQAIHGVVRKSGPNANPDHDGDSKEHGDFR
jgi:hypothetical protein